MNRWRSSTPRRLTNHLDMSTSNAPILNKIHSRHHILTPFRAQFHRRVTSTLVATDTRKVRLNMEHSYVPTLSKIASWEKLIPVLFCIFRSCCTEFTFCYRRNWFWILSINPNLAPLVRKRLVCHTLKCTRYVLHDHRILLPHMRRPHVSRKNYCSFFQPPLREQFISNERWDSRKPILEINRSTKYDRNQVVGAAGEGYFLQASGTISRNTFRTKGLRYASMNSNQSRFRIRALSVSDVNRINVERNKRANSHTYLTTLKGPMFYTNVKSKNSHDDPKPIITYHLCCIVVGIIIFDTAVNTIYIEELNDEKLSQLENIFGPSNKKFYSVCYVRVPL